MQFTRFFGVFTLENKETRYNAETNNPYFILRVNANGQLFDIISRDVRVNNLLTGQEIYVDGYLKGQINKNTNTGKEYAVTSLIGMRVMAEGDFK